MRRKLNKKVLLVPHYKMILIGSTLFFPSLILPFKMVLTSALGFLPFILPKLLLVMKEFKMLLKKYSTCI